METEETKIAIKYLQRNRDILEQAYGKDSYLGIIINRQETVILDGDRDELLLNERLKRKFPTFDYLIMSVEQKEYVGGPNISD